MGEGRSQGRRWSGSATVEAGAGPARSGTLGVPPTEPADANGERQDPVREFLGVLRRRKLALLLPVLLTPVLALVHSTLQQPLYSSSADVLVTSGSVAAALSELPGLASPDQPERNARTQVELARLPRVAERVIDVAPLEEDIETFLARSGVSARPDADILRFSVEDGDLEQAERLATLYAQAFTRYRNALDLQAIRSTQQTIARTIARLEAAGEGGSPVLRELRRATSQLEAAEAVQGSSAILVQPGVTAEQTAPRTVRDLVLAFVLGVIVGVGLAFLVERLDTRVRTPEEVEAILGLPLLGEIPSPPSLSEPNRSSVSMLDFPYGGYAEAIRKLRANLEFANLDVGARSVLVTSAVEREGKTTIASDLALALARSGRTVALCDLDPRAPSVDRMFNLGNRRGLVEIAFGIESLDDALVPIKWTTVSGLLVGDDGDSDDLLPATGASRPVGPSRGRLNVLPFGRRTPPSPGDFVGSGAVRHIVAELERTHDVVILDAPPLVPVSDALTISEYADAALVVCGLQTSQRPTLTRLRKLTASFPAHLLGLVVTGVPAPPGYGTYFAQGPDAQDASATLPPGRARV